MENIPEHMMKEIGDYPENLETSEIKRRFMNLLGDTHPVVEPEHEITDEITLENDIIRQRIEYNVDKDERVPAFLMFKQGIADDAPGVLSIHGHGGDEIFPVGKEHQAHPKADDPSQYSYRAALAGFRVIAPDALCFGERQAKWGYAKHFFDEVNAHAELCAHGKSLAWKSVVDNSCAVEVLEALGCPSVGVIGCSGGSTQAYILAAANEKVKAAVCLFSFMTLRHQFYQYRCCHCLYHFIPGMMNIGIDWDQVVSLIAPRKIFLGWGALDAGTPEPMYRAFVDAIEKRCEKEGLPQSVFCYEEPEMGHKISNAMLEESFNFLREYCK